MRMYIVKIDVGSIPKIYQIINSLTQPNYSLKSPSVGVLLLNWCANIFCAAYVSTTSYRIMQNILLKHVAYRHMILF